MTHRDTYIYHENLFYTFNDYEHWKPLQQFLTQTVGTDIFLHTGIKLPPFIEIYVRISMITDTTPIQGVSKFERFGLHII